MSADLDRSRRLAWRCRRGMRELDVLLAGWLERCWGDASETDRQAFERVLEFEDDRLWDWLSGRSDPTEPDLAGIVEKLRGYRCR